MAGEGSLLRVGSRKSELALIQTKYVISLLQKLRPEIQFELVTMATTGDKILDVALSKIGEKSLFTKELEIALEKKEVDFVVHSLKDLPTILPEGMVIGSVLEREDPRDAVVMKQGSEFSCLAHLPPGAVIGTSSLRRSAQLKLNFPQLKFQDIRGNLNTRLRKLDDKDGVYAAIILAVAGISRMGWIDRISEYLEPSSCMHAVGQGALGVECREGDVETLNLLSSLHHRETVLRTVAERSFLRVLEGGCSVPVAVTSRVTEAGISLDGGVWSIDGTKCVSGTNSVVFKNSTDSPKQRSYVGISANQIEAEILSGAELCGRELAELLISKGAEPILKEAKAQSVMAEPVK